MSVEGKKKSDILKKNKTGSDTPVFCSYENGVETGHAALMVDTETVYITSLCINCAEDGFTDAETLAELLVRTALNAGINRGAIYAESEIDGFDGVFCKLGFIKDENRFNAFIPDVFKGHCG